MPTDIEKLVVQLSADVRQYKKALDRAQADTNRAAAGIEGRFRKMNATVGKTFQGFGKNFGGGLLAGGIAGLVSAQTVRQIGDAIKSVADLGDEAERLGVKASDLQAIEFIGRQNGVEADKLTTALQKLNLEVGEARSKGNDLKKIFDANNLTFSNDPLENFRRVAELIRNAKTEQDKALIGAAAFGKAYADLIPLLNLGADAIRKGEQAARDTGAVISDELVAKAQEFDDAWQAKWDAFSATGKGAILAVASAIEEFLVNHPGFAEFLRKLESLTPGGVIIDDLKKGRNPLLNFGGTTEQEQLLELTERRATLEREIAELTAAGADPRLFEPWKAELAFILKQIAELQARIKATQITVGPGAGLSAVPLPGSGSTQGPTGNGTTVVPPGAADKLERAAGHLESVIDEFARDVAQAESGGNASAKNPLSSATGIGQFIESTWLRLFRENFPDRAASLSREGILALRNNAQVSFDLIKAYARENAAVLQKAGVSVTEANLQLAHFLGPGGAIDVLKAAPGTPVNQVLPQNVIAANQSVLGGNKTVDDVIAYAEARTRATEADRAAKEALDGLSQSHNDDAEAQRLENQLFGDQSLAATKLRLEYQFLTEAKRALGRELLPDEVAKIKAQADAMAELSFENQQLAEKQKETARTAEELQRAEAQAQQTIQAIGGALKGALQGFINDLIQGKSLTDALRDALINLGQSLLNIALDNLFSGLFSGGGGVLGGIFHAGSPSAGATGTSRRISPALYRGAPRYHSGGIAGLKPGEIPAILKRGEPIGPAAVNAAARRLIALGGSKLTNRNAGGSYAVSNTFIIPTERAALLSQNQIARKSAEALERARRTT
jgi:hypothetical protein